MDDEVMGALRAAIEADPELRQRFAQATTEQEIVAIARGAGIGLTLPGPTEGDLSDGDLEKTSGGYAAVARSTLIMCGEPMSGPWLCTVNC